MEGLGQWPFMIAIFVVFFVFMILPQRRRAKAEKNFAESLKRGDRVITKSGLHGKVFELNDKDNSCVIETMAGKLKFDRSAISMEMSNKLNAPSEKK
ncbi:preprotein translocase subunit YajC [Maribacter algarum]|uniref:Sec translocon accessory complex subunit YajC n=1 Tax=Maribacter algarum (ex Zhang et al. 2020) TaxID=2578118 RepID=A0A5S3PGI5_9FLAO|nr:preprotein translocase subunit YajC [Maribacter algarum]TMM53226.1 preprotein translocase subunit YajC [Maribacter algarum]